MLGLFAFFLLSRAIIEYGFCFLRCCCVGTFLLLIYSVVCLFSGGYILSFFVVIGWTLFSFVVCVVVGEWSFVLLFCLMWY